MKLSELIRQSAEEIMALNTPDAHAVTLVVPSLMAGVHSILLNAWMKLLGTTPQAVSVHARALVGNGTRCAESIRLSGTAVIDLP